MKAQIEVRVVVVLTMDVENVQHSVLQLRKEAELRIHKRLEYMIKEYKSDDMQLLPPQSSVKAQEEDPT